MGVACYRDLLFSNEKAVEWLQAGKEEYLSQTLGISAVMQTSDKKNILMHRSQHVGEYPDKLDVLGGHIDVQVDCQNFTADGLFAAIENEVRDEIGITANEFQIENCIGLLQNTATRKPELVFTGKTELGAVDIVSRTENAKENFEYTQLSFVDADLSILKPFLEKNGEKFTPSATGCLFLFADFIKNLTHSE
ncbi:MAG: hypothetical protein DWQ05_02590 [Calditrichaeota bacterium]|nr:MAG: hypothetical protein DWQ05_02590 [Calditrichota bacterium]